MKTLAIIREHEVFTDRTPVDDSSYSQERQAVRVFLFDDEGNIGALYYPPSETRTQGEYLLVGGGVEEGETLEEALAREVKEEAGCLIHQIEEIGHIKQYGIGKGVKRIQNEYFYKVHVFGNKGEPDFDEHERKNKVEIHWVPLEKFIEAMEMQRVSFGRTNTLMIYKNHLK